MQRFAATSTRGHEPFRGVLACPATALHADLATGSLPVATPVESSRRPEGTAIDAAFGLPMPTYEQANLQWRRGNLNSVKHEGRQAIT